MIPARSILGALLTTLSMPVSAEVRFHDDCGDPRRWEVLPSDGVEGRLSAAEGPSGPCLRLDFDFRRGAGYCIVRRPVDLPLPENYRFRVRIRAEAPVNNFEFKLSDAGGENVWWVNQRNYEFPREWTTVSYRARHFQFAWGPSGGRRIERLGAIELVVAASTGGRGTLFFDDLTFEPLAAAQPDTSPARLEYSSTAPGAPTPPGTLPEDGQVAWRSAADDPAPALTMTFGQPREFGGLLLKWSEERPPSAYIIESSLDLKTWERVAALDPANGGSDSVPLADGEALALRVRAQRAPERGVGIENVVLLPPEFALSWNATWSQIASSAPRGLYPRIFCGQQTAWTVIGVPVDAQEALIDEFGSIEPLRGGFRIEPFVWDGERLVTWADVDVTQSLADGYVPSPRVVWRGAGIELEIEGVVDGAASRSELLVRYTLRNTGDRERDLSLFLALRPFQVLPPWQELNLAGGAARIDRISWDGRRARINDACEVRPLNAPTAFGATPFSRGEIVEDLLRGGLPEFVDVTDPWRRASAALRYDAELPAGATLNAVLSIPLHAAPEAMPPALTPEAASSTFDAAAQRVRRFWSAETTRVGLSLPPAADRIANTFRTTQAYILINADGPAIQPGSRTYERSWIRDGAITSTALLYTGHAEAVRAFLMWYAPNQFENGKVPCVVDRRGPDPVPEHDSTGQFIYALMNHYRFTGDRELLERTLPQVVRGVDYIESLRAQRLTPEYRDGPPELRARYGLVTESISHEGYSAKPMHSYWDSFWTLRGLKDGAAIAALLGRDELQQRFERLLGEYRAAVSESVRLAMRNTGVDYVPGCVELGDFDATSTSTVVFPCDEADVLPPAALRRTFEKYIDFARRRASGEAEWRDYTPYELRTIGTLVELGYVSAAHELLDFFMQHQYPPGWNHWAEVVHRDPLAPRFIGDMPHTWVGAEFICSLRTMLLYERQRDNALVLAAGVRPEWLAAPGVRIDQFPTPFGAMSYSYVADGDSASLEFRFGGPAPAGGFVVMSPPGWQPRGATVDGAAVTLEWIEEPQRRAFVVVRASSAKVVFAR